MTDMNDKVQSVVNQGILYHLYKAAAFTILHRKFTQGYRVTGTKSVISIHVSCHNYKVMVMMVLKVMVMMGMVMVAKLTIVQLQRENGWRNFN